jgi:hypothetical protein
MKKIKLGILILSCIIISKCSESNEPEILKTDSELLTLKEWNFDTFEFISSSNNISNITNERIEQYVNNDYEGNVTYKFNSDKSGQLVFKTEIRNFNWELNNKNLNLDFSNNDYNTEYLLNSINNSNLNLSFASEARGSIDGTEISFNGNYIYK